MSKRNHTYEKVENMDTIVTGSVVVASDLVLLWDTSAGVMKKMPFDEFSALVNAQ